MKTIPLNNKECSDVLFIENKQSNYTYAFRKLHKHYHKIDDKKFEDSLRKKYNLTDIEFRSLKSDVSTKFSQTVTNKQGQEEELMWAEHDLKELKNNGKKSKNNTRNIFKKHNKIKSLEDSLIRNITFGQKVVLRALVKLYNNVHVIKNDIKKTPEEKEKLLSENKLNIEKKTKEWHDNRVLHFYILGEANQKGNRFFDFDFKNHTIIYKPFKGKKVEFKYSCSKTYQKELLKLKELIDAKEISITVQVSIKQICISFDNEVLSGYYIDKKERTKEVKEINKQNLSKEEKTIIIKQVYQKYHEELRKQKLVGKVEERYVAVDLNPDYIGYCIADKGENGISKIIEKGVIDLRDLHEKLNLPSDHPDVLKQNNKREFEINNSWKSFFNVINHYKCAYFIKEDIDGISKNEAFENREANRKVRNVWHREITNWQIEKRCIEAGIEVIPIIPVYTSFIGNIMYDYFDATNAAIEICRRGMFKFKKGLFYPAITGTIFDTMSKFFIQQKIELKLRDAQIFKNCESWISLYKIAADNGLRWRWSWSEIKKTYSTFSVNNIKSKVNIVRFSDYCL